jgi:hypothetical protein
MVLRPIPLKPQPLLNVSSHGPLVLSCSARQATPAHQLRSGPHAHYLTSGVWRIVKDLMYIVEPASVEYCQGKNVEQGRLRRQHNSVTCSRSRGRVYNDFQTEIPRGSCMQSSIHQSRCSVQSTNSPPCTPKHTPQSMHRPRNASYKA